MTAAGDRYAFINCDDVGAGTMSLIPTGSVTEGDRSHFLGLINGFRLDAPTVTHRVKTVQVLSNAIQVRVKDYPRKLLSMKRWR